MKAVFAVTCCLLVMACEGEKPSLCTVYVFLDATEAKYREANHYLSDLPIILRKMNVDTVHGGNNGAEVRFFLINDLSESKSKVRLLSQGVSGMMGQNPLERRDEIKKFSRGLSQDLQQLLSSAQWQTNQSKIYQNLCRGLNNLKAAGGDRKIVIVYSDMLENSDLFSFYEPRSGKIERYIEDPRLAELELSADCAMPDLSGVEINIVAFRNKENDEMINRASQFWLRLFQSHNATIHFGSELD